MVNRHGQIRHVPLPILDDEKKKWLEARRGSGSSKTKDWIYKEHWNRGEQTHGRCTYESGDGHGEKNKADETGLEVCVVEDLLEAIAVTHIVVVC